MCVIFKCTNYVAFLVISIYYYLSSVGAHDVATGIHRRTLWKKTYPLLVTAVIGKLFTIVSLRPIRLKIKWVYKVYLLYKNLFFNYI